MYLQPIVTLYVTGVYREYPTTVWFRNHFKKLIGVLKQDQNFQLQDFIVLVILIWKMLVNLNLFPIQGNSFQRLRF
jgi:hypothetical protein